MRRLGRLLVLAVWLGGCGGGYVVRRVEEPAVSATAETDSTTPADTVVVPTRPADQYTVKPGDTLETVAKVQLGSPMLARHVAEWNKLDEHAPLAVGAVIRIPLQVRGIVGGAPAVALPVPTPQPVPAAPVPVARFPGRPPSEVFKVGEKLTFDVKWYAITGGQAVMTVGPIVEMDGRQCYHFMATAISKMLFFFKVEDKAESFSTADQLLPIRWEKHIHEGGYKKDEIATFDRNRLISKWGNDPETPFLPDSRDILGSFYYFRTMPLPAPGKDAVVNVHSGGKNYQLVVNVLRREDVEVPAGKFRTILIKPRLKFEGLFNQKGDVLIWLTDDAARVPVLVQSKVFLLGSVDIVLTKLENGQ